MCLGRFHPPHETQAQACAHQGRICKRVRRHAHCSASSPDLHGCRTIPCIPSAAGPTAGRVPIQPRSAVALARCMASTARQQTVGMATAVLPRMCSTQAGCQHAAGSTACLTLGCWASGHALDPNEVWHVASWARASRMQVFGLWLALVRHGVAYLTRWVAEGPK